MNYLEVDKFTVPRRIRWQAEGVCARCCRELGLGFVAISWIKEVPAPIVNIERMLAKLEIREATAFRTDVPISGQVRNLHPGEIQINVDQSDAEIIKAVRHELIHQKQIAERGIWWPSQNPDCAEREAREYETLGQS